MFYKNYEVDISKVDEMVAALICGTKLILGVYNKYYSYVLINQYKRLNIYYSKVDFLLSGLQSFTFVFFFNENSNKALGKCPT